MENPAFLNYRLRNWNDYRETFKILIPGCCGGFRKMFIFFLKETRKYKTQIPTMKWVFFLFRKITELVIEIDGKKFRKILNLDEETIKILNLMGEKYEKYYM